LGQHLYDSTRNFYLRHNFRLYGQAYSRFRSTFRSMSAMMNFDSSSLNPLVKYSDATERPESMHANAYFRQAAEAGYDIQVFQTQHFDFCNSTAVTRCETLNSYSPISRFISYPEKNFLYRTANLLAMMVTTFSESNWSRTTSSVLNKVGGFGNWFDAESFPLWFEHLMHRVVEAPRGTMIFAHFLAPHAPYALGQDCELKRRIPPHYREDKTPRDEETWPAFRARYQERYYEQALCIHHYTERLLQALEASGRFHDAVIIVHGDHGSRIARSDYAEYMSSEDLVANYATLFAIRKPGLAGGYDLELVSVQELFIRHVLSPGTQNISLRSPVVEDADPLDKATAAASATEPRKHSVVVRKAKTGELEEAAMPGFSARDKPC
ncbi:MAG: sulfatase-like hydrolase/transferase, partial [Pyrinomonadaceae bacterium]